MVVIWENSGTKEAFELMEEHFVEGGWTETEEWYRTSPTSLKLEALLPSAKGSSINIRHILENLIQENEELWISFWAKIPRTPNYPFSWNTISKFWVRHHNELGQRETLQISMGGVDGRGYFSGRALK